MPDDNKPTEAELGQSLAGASLSAYDRRYRELLTEEVARRMSRSTRTIQPSSEQDSITTAEQYDAKLRELETLVTATKAFTDDLGKRLQCASRVEPSDARDAEAITAKFDRMTDLSEALTSCQGEFSKDSLRSARTTKILSDIPPLGDDFLNACKAALKQVRSNQGGDA